MRRDHSGAMPALGALAALASGCLLALSLERAQPLPFLLAGGALGALTLALRGRAASVALFAAIALAGAGWADLRLHTLPSDSLARSLSASPSLVRVEGVILERPVTEPMLRGLFEPFAINPTVTRFVLRVDSRIDPAGARAEASGRLFVQVAGSAPDLHAGDRVRVTGMAVPPRPSRNPGEPDTLRLAAQQGDSGFLSVASPALVQPAELRADALASVASLTARIRSAARARASRWLSDAEGSDGRALLVAALLGEREDAADEMHDAFARLGLAHLLSVSGMHLAILVLAALLALRFLADLGGAEPLAIAALVLLYLAIVPVRTPVLRAAILVLAFLIADSRGRRYDRLALLAWTGAAILIWRPMELLSAGAQLSFACVAALIVIEPRLRERLAAPLPDPDLATRAQRLRQAAARLIAASVACWIVATPIVAVHLGVLSPFAVLASILFAPVFSVILALGYLSLLAGALLPPLAGAIDAVLFPVAAGVSRAASFADSLPLTSVHLPPISPLWACAAVACAFWALTRERILSPRPALAAALLAVWIAPSLRTPSLPDDVALRIDALHVGDGTCILVRSGRDAILFDAGSQRLHAGRRELPRALRALGAPRIRRAILSHPNLDHFAALPDLARPLGLREALAGPAVVPDAQESPDGATAFLLRQLAMRGVRVTTVAAGDAVALDGARVEILSPAPGAQWRKDNDASLVIRIEVDTDAGPRAALLTGDIEDDAVRALRAAHPDLRADIVEVPHHGSARPPAMALVASLRAAVALQSTGHSRVDDDRWRAVREATPRWLVTARDGAVHAEILRSGEIRAGSMREAPATVAPALQPSGSGVNSISPSSANMTLGWRSLRSNISSASVWPSSMYQTVPASR